MQDAAVMGVLERRRELTGDRAHLRDRKMLARFGSFSYHLSQGPARHEFHGDEGVALVDRPGDRARDPRMIEGSECHRFTSKPLDDALIATKLGVKELDRDRLSPARTIRCKPHRSEAAAPERLLERESSR